MKWWLKSVFHNMIVHPVLPLADALSSTRFRGISFGVYYLHDHYVPEEAG